MVFALNNLTVSHNAYLITGRQVSLHLDIAIVNTVIEYITDKTKTCRILTKVVCMQIFMMYK